ncbi:MAG: hypothetical protein HY904_20820 [Deltaproteobacteria bacterium]|nr:hypothetical protein [Deltaproteobacteria bacterium]
MSWALLLSAVVVAAALPPAGEWRLDRQDTKVKVLAWGMFCGKEPRDGRGLPGARYVLTHDGTGFVLKGAGKAFGTVGCSMDPPIYKQRLADKTQKGWRVECEAPPIAGTPQVNEHVFEVEDAAIRYVTRGEKRKTENLEACRYAYETEMRFVLATESGPCASPGPAARLVVEPGTVDARPGQRICFKASATDAHDCAVPAGAVAYAVEPKGVGELDGNGCLWAPREIKDAVVLAVTATAGDVRGNSVVRVAPEEAARTESIEQTAARTGSDAVKQMVSQVRAGDFVVKAPFEEEEEPAAAPAAPVATPPADAPGLPPWLPVAGGGAVVVVAALAFALARRKKPAQVPAPPPVVAPPVAAPEAGRGYKCPQCGFEYAAAGKCVHDGTELVINEARGRQTLFIPQVGGMVCPTCGQKYPTRARFCGNDRTPLVPDLPKL